MEGLEISEIPLVGCKNEDYSFRIDGEFYAKENLSTMSHLFRHPNDKLINMVSKIDVGFVGSMVNDYSLDIKDPILLQTKNINEFFVDTSDVKRINLNFHKQLKKSQINFGDILIARSGSFGKASIYLGETDVNSADIIIVKSKDDSINPYYLLTFINSKFGVCQLMRFASGGLQGHVNLTILENLVIPYLSNNFQHKIELIVKESFDMQQLASELYKNADCILLAELGLKDWVPTNQSSTTKKFADFLGSGRLDAEYYQPKYDEIEKQIANYGCGNIDQLFELKDKNFIPKNDVQYKYIELSNIGGSGEITGCSYEYGSDLPSRARRKVNTGDVIVSSIEGSLQSCAIITEEYNNSLCSTGFYVLAPKMISAETSLILFKSAPIQQLMKKVCSGTILTAMNKDEFVNIHIPIVAEDIQQQITDKVQKSFELRAESKRLLDLAKTTVEIAIEQGEQKALELLNQN